MVNRHKNLAFRANTEELTAHLREKIDYDYNKDTLVKILQRMQDEKLIDFSLTDEYIYIKKGE